MQQICHFNTPPQVNKNKYPSFTMSKTPSRSFNNKNNNNKIKWSIAYAKELNITDQQENAK